MSIKQFRGGSGSQCEERRNTFERTFISPNLYSNMYNWFVGENIQQYLNDGVQIVGGGGCDINNVFLLSSH